MNSTDRPADPNGVDAASPTGHRVCAGERPEDEPQEPRGTNTLTPEPGSVRAGNIKGDAADHREGSPPHPARHRVWNIKVGRAGMDMGP